MYFGRRPAPHAEKRRTGFGGTVARGRLFCQCNRRSEEAAIGETFAEISQQRRKRGRKPSAATQTHGKSVLTVGRCFGNMMYYFVTLRARI